MITVNGQNVNQVHVRHDGRSHGVFTEDLGLPNGDVTKAELFSAIENALDLNVGSLGGYELDVAAETANAVIRPQAKFGI